MGFNSGFKGLKNSVYSSHRTLPLSIAKTGRLMLVRGIVGVYCENNSCGKRRIS